MWRLRVPSPPAWVFSRFSSFLPQSSDLHIRLIRDSKLSLQFLKKIILLNKSGVNHKLLFLAGERSRSSDTVLEQDAETQNAACDWLRRLRTEMSSPDTVNTHGRQIRREKLTAHSRNVPPSISC